MLMKIISFKAPRATSKTERRLSDSEAVSERRRTEQAIFETLLYSDIFDYPLTSDEITHYLMDIACSQERVCACLAAPIWLKGRITQVENYITLCGREYLVEERRNRADSSRRLWATARIFCRILSILPFVRMVAVTGALAMNNSGEKDDVDVLIVTEPNRVWLARALAILVVYAGKLVSSNALCPNYVISRDSLALEPRTVYVAHEFVQMVPLYGYEVYQAMRAANSWVESLLPNACRPLRGRLDCSPGLFARSLKKILESLLSGMVGTWIEKWEMRRKVRKFSARATGLGDSVIFDRTQVKGHFDDHGKKISSRYYSRLEEHRLEIPQAAVLAKNPSARPATSSPEAQVKLI